MPCASYNTWFETIALVTMTDEPGSDNISGIVTMDQFGIIDNQPKRTTK